MGCMVNQNISSAEDVYPLNFGTGTNTATSFTISDNSNNVVNSRWIMTNGIVLDEVRVILSTDSATTVNVHLMSFDFISGS